MGPAALVWSIIWGAAASATKWLWPGRWPPLVNWSFVSRAALRPLQRQPSPDDGGAERLIGAAGYNVRFPALFGSQLFGVGRWRGMMQKWCCKCDEGPTMSGVNWSQPLNSHGQNKLREANSDWLLITNGRASQREQQRRAPRRACHLPTVVRANMGVGRGGAAPKG